MKPICIKFEMPENAMKLIASLTNLVTDENKDCIVMLQVRESGYTEGFWLPKELTEEAMALGDKIVKAYKS